MHAFAQSESNGLLIDTLLTAKAVTLVFISGRGSATIEIRSYLYFGEKINKLFEPRKRACIS